MEPSRVDKIWPTNPPPPFLRCVPEFSKTDKFLHHFCLALAMNFYPHDIHSILHIATWTGLSHQCYASFGLVITNRVVAVAHQVERSPPTPDIRSSNLVSGNLFYNSKIKKSNVALTDRVFDWLSHYYYKSRLQVLFFYLRWYKKKIKDQFEEAATLPWREHSQVLRNFFN